MITGQASLMPPQLSSVEPLLRQIPGSLHTWIAEKHVQYLDDRIHKIGRLTDYLANCHQVEKERNEFVEFVLAWTRQPNPDLTEYLSQYRSRFASVRSRVEELCAAFLAKGSSPKLDGPFIEFWREFAKINEIDSIHGMFLTSGRWYVNVMLPAIKELALCFLAGRAGIPVAERSEMAFVVARRVITPRFADLPAQYDLSHERKFATFLMPILQHFDRKLCFLFEVFAQFPDLSFQSIAEFAEDVASNHQKFQDLLTIGIYPPFAWHELHASRKPRRPAKPLAEAAAPFFGSIPVEFHERAKTALDCLSILKEYELNYNNYNYKGRFGLVSKYQYSITAGLLGATEQQAFLEAILLDRFFDALEVLESAARAGHSKTITREKSNTHKQ